MLPRKYRLNLRTERNRVTQTGKTLHSLFFTVISSPIPPSKVEGGQGGVSHFSTIVSTKFHPHAVKRHQTKRLIYQIIRENLNQIPSGRDFIIIPKKTILSTNKGVLAHDLINLLNG